MKKTKNEVGIWGLSSNEITKQALEILRSWDYEVWRQNQIPVRGRAFIGKEGQSDIMGYNRLTGTIVACEVKRFGDTLSDKQIEFLSNIKKAGGISLIATELNGYEVYIMRFDKYMEIRP